MCAFSTQVIFHLERQEGGKDVTKRSMKRLGGMGSEFASSKGLNRFLPTLPEGRNANARFLDSLRGGG